MISRQTINLSNTTISTLQSGTGSRYLFFLHGNSMSADTWLPQLTDAWLSNEYLMIAIDLPGCGQSDRLAIAEDYQPKQLALIVKELVEHFAPQAYLLIGLSYGTNIIGEMQQPPAGCAGVMLASACIVNEENPASDVIIPVPSISVVTAADPDDDELHRFMNYCAGNNVLAKRAAIDYRRTDPQLRLQMAVAMGSGGLSNELANIANLHMPVCLVWGNEEKLLHTHYLDNYAPAQGNIHRLPGGWHVVNETAPDAFNQVLFRFASDAFK